MTDLHPELGPKRLVPSYPDALTAVRRTYPTAYPIESLDGDFSFWRPDAERHCTEFVAHAWTEGSDVFLRIAPVPPPCRECRL